MRVITWPTKPLSCLLVVAMLSGVIPYRPARAELVGTESVITPASTPERDRARLRALLARQDVQAQLKGYGISAEEATARADALTDREIALVADRLDEVPAGGDPVLAIAFVLFFFPVIAFVAAMAGMVGLVAWAADRSARQGTASWSTSDRGARQGTASWSTERAAQETLCRRRHLETVGNWRDRLPDYRACLAQ